MKLSVLVALFAYMARSSLADTSSVEHPAYSPISKVNADSFYEPFDIEDWESKWVVSHAQRDGEFTYVGKWNVEESTVNPGFSGDKGLVLKSEAAHHAISLKLPELFDNKDNTLVLQYEVKLQKGLSCGGAYIKLLSADGLEGDFNNDTPYQVMFGPDRCGVTNKVHFIVKRKNPVTNEYEEHHLSATPLSRVVKTTTLYTLIIKPTQEFEIRINGDVAKAGSLLDENTFSPPFTPSKEIEDETDVKPVDWVDEEYIPDPNATKPDDWDEDAPFYIPDPKASKPADWDENMPETIPDPSESQPEDWDEEEDGEWMAPEIPNPECESHGCGPWEAPQIQNPNFKGKWSAPMIPNPAYKGEWAPRLVSNPNYYEDNTPSNLEPIGGLGFELWTMNEDILFDNIYLGHDIAEAEFIGNNTFLPKVKIEEEVAAKNAPKADFEPEAPPTSYTDEAVNFFSSKVDDVVNWTVDYLHGADEFFKAFLTDPLPVFFTRFNDLAYYVSVFIGFLFIVFGFFGFIVASLFGDAVPGLIEQPAVAKKEDDEDVNEIKEEVTGVAGAEANETVATKRSAKST